MTHTHILYQHVKRPEWGFSTVVEMQERSTTYLFVDGRQRTITIDHVHLMQRVELQDDAEAEEVHRKLAKYRRAKPPTAVKRKRVRSVLASSPAAVTVPAVSPPEEP